MFITYLDLIKYRTHADFVMEQLFDSIIAKNYRQDVEVVPCCFSHKLR